LARLDQRLPQGAAVVGKQVLGQAGLEVAAAVGWLAKVSEKQTLLRHAGSLWLAAGRLNGGIETGGHSVAGHQLLGGQGPHARPMVPLRPCITGGAGGRLLVCLAVDQFADQTLQIKLMCYEMVLEGPE